MSNIILKPKKDKVTSALLAWFLGAFGAHRFYLGQNGMGIGYLLGTLTIIGALFTTMIAFVDAIGLLVMSQDTFDMRYNPEHYFLERGGNANANQYNHTLSEAHVNVADEIIKLDALFKSGVITFEEFERRKARLLNT